MSSTSKFSIKNTALILISFICFVSFSTNPPNGKTGAPGESICTECHNPSSNTITGIQSIEGLPSLIHPGEIYTLTVSNTYLTGNAVRSGFQMVALNESNSSTGTFSNPSASSVISTESGRDYFEHTPALFFQSDSTVSWTVDWEAPDAPLGDSITFYSSGILGNGSQNSGDKLITNQVKALLDMPSSMHSFNSFDSNINVFPNPADDFINLEYSGNELVENITINDMGGRKLYSQSIYDNQTKIFTGDFENGLHILIIETANNISSKKILIQH